MHFSRPFNDWEMDEVDGFLLSLNGKSVQQDEEDKVLWTETKCGKSFVKSLYKALEPSSTISFPQISSGSLVCSLKSAFLGGRRNCS